MQQTQGPAYNRSDTIPQPGNSDHAPQPHNPTNATNEQPTWLRTPFNMVSRTQNQGIICAFGPLVTPDNKQPMEVEFPTINRSSRVVRSSRPQPHKTI